MTEVIMRRARAEDVDDIVALLADDPLGATRERPGDPGYATAFRKLDQDPGQLLAVAEVDGEVVGTLQLRLRVAEIRLRVGEARLRGVMVGVPAPA